MSVKQARQLQELAKLNLGVRPAYQVCLRLVRESSVHIDSPLAVLQLFSAYKDVLKRSGERQAERKCD